MLDVGFSEILLTSAIALIVLGPERLPKVARQVGNWMGRARAMARQLTEQLEREVSAEELLKTQNEAQPPRPVRHPRSHRPPPSDTRRSRSPPSAAAASAATAARTAPPCRAAWLLPSDTTASGHACADWHPSPPSDQTAP